MTTTDRNHAVPHGAALDSTSRSMQRTVDRAPLPDLTDRSAFAESLARWDAKRRAAYDEGAAADGVQPAPTDMSRVSGEAAVDNGYDRNSVRSDPIDCHGLASPLMPPQQQASAVVPITAPPLPAALDEWIDRLLLAQGDRPRELRMQLTNSAWPLTAIAVKIVNGNLNLVLAAPNHAHTGLERRLDDLRRRLIARGHGVDEIRVVGEGEDALASLSGA